MTRMILILLTTLYASAVLAEAKSPMTDVDGARDLPWLKRYEGSYIVSYEQRSFEAFAFPSSPLVESKDGATDIKNNRLAVSPRNLSAEGRYTRLVYIVPEGRSTLEVMRNYIEEIKANGGKSVYGCKDTGCGGDLVGNDHGGGTQGLLEQLYPQSRMKDNFASTGYCATSEGPAEQRYYLATQPDDAGANRVIATYAYRIDAQDDHYCGVLNGRTGVLVVTIEPKAIERKMVVVSADEMAKALSASGTVSLYGIYFDFDKATIRPESRPTLEQLTKLLVSQPALRLSVVGHTDNIGDADYNMTLSRRRAIAVVNALIKDFGIASERLEPIGAGITRPIASNDREAGRATNRRVELVKR